MGRRPVGYRAILEVSRGKDDLPMGNRQQAAKQMGAMAERIILQHIATNDFAMNPIDTTDGQVRGSEKVSNVHSPNTDPADLGDVHKYHADYARRHRKNERKIDFETIGGSRMKRELHGTHKYRGGNIVALVKFQSPDAAQIFRYHQVLGAGINKIRRVFVYFNKAERRRIMKAVSSELLRGS